jgi:hypothetical protein
MTCRKVYLELEPAWYMIMSASILKPDINHLQLRLSPGYCKAALGAVEHVDWRHSHTFDRMAEAGSSGGLSPDSAISTGVAAAAAASTTLTARINPQDAVAAQQGLRALRDRQIFSRLVAVINGSAPERTGWFLKQNIRQDYTNESLARSPVTADGQLDTAPGYLDARGILQNQGPWYRHRRSCVPGANCNYNYVIYRYLAGWLGQASLRLCELEVCPCFLQ